MANAAARNKRSDAAPLALNLEHNFDLENN